MNKSSIVVSIGEQFSLGIFMPHDKSGSQGLWLQYSMHCAHVKYKSNLGTEW